MTENDRDCEHCKHYVRVKDKDYYACEKWNCEYEPEQEVEDDEQGSN